MDADEFRSMGHTLVERLAAWIEGSEDGPVLPSATPREVDDRMQGPVPECPSMPDQVLRSLEDDLFPYSTKLSSPGYLGLITPSPLPIGALGDLVASTINQNVGVWSIGPAGTAMERQVVRWLCGFVGFGAEAGGNLVSGGMAANLTALKLARDFASGDTAQSQGARGNAAVYVSEERHISIDKAVDIVGFGRNALRPIPTDDRYEIRLDLLEEAVSRDKAEGTKPACLVALAGTTNTGSVDDLRALRAVADREGMWLHADAAYGGGMLLSSRHPGVLDGVGLADSVTVDPHKWLFAPLDVGAVLVKDASRLAKSFGMKPAYLTDGFDGQGERYNFYEHGMDQSKRLRALKVKMIFQRYGTKQIGEWIDQNVTDVFRLHQLVSASPPFLSACEPKMSAMCVRYQPEGVPESTLGKWHAEVAQAVERDGRFWIGTTSLKGKSYLRLCAVNLYTRFEHLEALFDLLKAEFKKRS